MKRLLVAVGLALPSACMTERLPWNLVEFTEPCRMQLEQGVRIETNGNNDLTTVMLDNRLYLMAPDGARPLGWSCADSGHSLVVAGTYYYPTAGKNCAEMTTLASGELAASAHGFCFDGGKFERLPLGATWLTCKNYNGEKQTRIFRVEADGRALHLATTAAKDAETTTLYRAMASCEFVQQQANVPSTR